MNKYFSNKYIRIFLIVFIVVLVTYILIYFYNIEQTNKQSFLLNTINEFTIENVPSFEHPIEKNERMLKIEELQKENSELVGWIEIPNTIINYPVLLGNDNEFYLNHNYKKEVSKSGSIFIDADYSFSPRSANLLIYGHNMKNGTMFTSLLNYKNKDYYKEHPYIRFTTATSDETYEVIAAFESKVYNDSDDIFKYYNFINTTSEKEFDDFIYNVKTLTTYETDATAKYGDMLITLSTCAYHTKDGRFAVVGKSV